MTNSEKNTSMISKKVFLEQYCYNEIYFSELFYGFGDDTTATLKSKDELTLTIE